MFENGGQPAVSGGEAGEHSPARRGVLTHFVAGAVGAWRVERVTAVRGPGLDAAPRLGVAVAPGVGDVAWTLRGVASHTRYTTRREATDLEVVSPPLGRVEARHAVLIPIRKSDAWWALAQDERRAIFEERSHHVASSLPYLPRVARRLYHARDLGEPFDFLTWFEHAPEHGGAFDELLEILRAQEEWTYVERELEVRLVRAD